jgi:hypothetical protein
MPNRKPGSSNKLNFWAMMNNVLITSLSKGQFPIACLFFVFVVILLKMPGDEVARMALGILADLGNFKLVGYALSIVLAGGWFIHTRWQRSKYEKELKRLVEERNQLQEGSGLGQLVESSESRKAAKKRRR